MELQEDDRECVMWSSYVIRERQPARYTRHKDNIETEMGWRCPRCDAKNTRTIEHGHIGRCVHCGLYAEVSGNSMYLSGDDPKGRYKSRWSN